MHHYSVFFFREEVVKVSKTDYNRYVPERCVLWDLLPQPMCPLHAFSTVIKIYVLLWALGITDRQLRSQQSVNCQRQTLNVRWCPRQCQAV